MASSEARRSVYLDASALVKLVTAEDETDALVAYLDDARIVASELAAVDVPRASLLKTGDDAMVAYAESVLEDAHLVVLDEDLRRSAARAKPADLRTLDAIHLASALRVREHVEAAVIYDRRLADAARAAGLRVVAPGR